MTKADEVREETVQLLMEIMEQRDEADWTLGAKLIRSGVGWQALSPDGVPIEMRTWPIALVAIRALNDWCERFRAQGFYECADGTRIPFDELAGRCVVVPPRIRLQDLL